jgi:putative Holliday junction resolvase
LADAIRQNFRGEVILWDESGSTNAVQDLYITMNVPKSKRRGHQDARAAAYILQDYLDWLAFQKQYKKEDQQDE